MSAADIRVARFLAECRLSYLLEEARATGSPVAADAAERAREDLRAIIAQSHQAELESVSA